jgi:hypothetical protein
VYEQGNAKYFKFRDLNGSNYNVVGIADIPYDFYSLIPEPYKMAYMEIWRSRLWLSGKVPGIHNFLLSSNIGSTIASIFANRIVGENGMFDGKNTEANEYMEDWADGDDFKNKISELSYLMSGTGQAIIKMNLINKRSKGGKKLKYSCEVLGGDRYFAKFVGNDIEEIKIFTNFYQDTTTHQGEAKTDYYLIEVRKYDENDKPVGYYSVVENKSIFTEGAYRSEQHEYDPDLMREHFSTDEIKEICDKLGITPRELLTKHELPFKLGLGVAAVRNSYVHPRFTSLNVGCSDISKISEDTLVTYELYVSLLSNEGSVTIPLVMLPKRLYNPNIDAGAQFIPLDERFSNETQGASPYQQGYAVVDNRSRKIDGTYITYVDSEEPENQQPKLVQFNMRMEDIDKGVQRTLLFISNNLEISPLMLDPRLRGSTQYKNVHEINMDENLTSNTIENKRNMIKHAINYVVNEVLLYGGFKEEDSSYMLKKFENNDEKDLTETLILQLSNGLVSKDVARRRLYNHMRKEEFTNMLKQIEDDKKEKLDEEIEKLKLTTEISNKSNPNKVKLGDKPSNADRLGKKNEQLQKGKVGNASVNTNVDYNNS